MSQQWVCPKCQLRCGPHELCCPKCMTTYRPERKEARTSKQMDFPVEPPAGREFTHEDPDLDMLLNATAMLLSGRGNMDTGIYWYEALEKVQKRLRPVAESTDDGSAVDAAKWRALRNCARITAMGCAGLTQPHNVEDDYAHLTLNFWTGISDGDPGPGYAREWLDMFVAKALRAMPPVEPADRIMPAGWASMTPDQLAGAVIPEKASGDPTDRDVIEAVAELHHKLECASVEMDAEAKRVLYGNILSLTRKA